MRIIGQPLTIEAYKIGHSSDVKTSISDDDKDMQLIKSVYKFGLKHGYLAAIDDTSISKSTYYNY